MSTIRKTITVTDQQDSWIKAQIAGGAFTNDSEYIRDLIRRDQSETEDEQRWLRKLDASIERGLEDEKAGRLYDLGEVCAEIQAEIEGMAGEQPLQ